MDGAGAQVLQRCRGDLRGRGGKALLRNKRRSAGKLRRLSRACREHVDGLSWPRREPVDSLPRACREPGETPVSRDLPLGMETVMGAARRRASVTKLCAAAAVIEPSSLRSETRERRRYSHVHTKRDKK